MGLEPTKLDDWRQHCTAHNLVGNTTGLSMGHVQIFNLKVKSEYSEGMEQHYGFLNNKSIFLFGIFHHLGR